MSKPFKPTAAQLRDGKATARRYLLAGLAKESEAQLLAAIKVHQDVQKRNAPTTDRWQSASRSLELLFTEMRRRYPAGTIGPAVLS